MAKFIPDDLLKHLLQEYLMVHWTDSYSTQPNFPAEMQRQDCEFRLAMLDEADCNKLKELLITKFLVREETINKCSFFFNKLHDGDFISDYSYSEFMINITNNGTQWYDSSKGKHVELGYNEGVDTKGMTLQLPRLEDSAYYFIDAYICSSPENA